MKTVILATGSSVVFVILETMKIATSLSVMVVATPSSTAVVLADAAIQHRMLVNVPTALKVGVLQTFQNDFCSWKTWLWEMSSRL